MRKQRLWFKVLIFTLVVGILALSLILYFNRDDLQKVSNIKTAEIQARAYFKAQSIYAKEFGRFAQSKKELGFNTEAMKNFTIIESKEDLPMEVSNDLTAELEPYIDDRSYRIIIHHEPFSSKYWVSDESGEIIYSNHDLTREKFQHD